TFCLVRTKVGGRESFQDSERGGVSRGRALYDRFSDFLDFLGEALSVFTFLEEALSIFDFLEGALSVFTWGARPKIAPFWLFAPLVIATIIAFCEGKVWPVSGPLTHRYPDLPTFTQSYPSCDGRDQTETGDSASREEHSRTTSADGNSMATSPLSGWLTWRVLHNAGSLPSGLQGSAVRCHSLLLSYL